MGHENALTAPLGLVERAVGRTQQLIGGLAVTRRACAPDAYPDMYRCRKTEIKWGRDAGNDALGFVRGVVGGDSRQQDDEFITTNAGYEIERPNAVAQALRHGNKNGIPRGVAEAVIDVFEAIEIEAEYHEFLA